LLDTWFILEPMGNIWVALVRVPAGRPTPVAAAPRLRAGENHASSAGHEWPRYAGEVEPRDHDRIGRGRGNAASTK